MGMILAALNSHFGIATHENVLIHFYNPFWYAKSTNVIAVVHRILEQSLSRS